MFDKTAEYEIEPLNCKQYKCIISCKLKDKAIDASLVKTYQYEKAKHIFSNGYVPIPKHLYNLFNIGIKKIMKAIGKETDPKIIIDTYNIIDAYYKKLDHCWIIKMHIEGDYKLIEN
jgi:hypothetical protein